MKIGITGYRGFIGNSVAKALSHQNHQIISLDAYTRSEGANKFDLKEIPTDLNWVLHFGASTSIQASFNNPFLTYHNNFDSTLLALKIAHTSQAAFLLMSSYVYGIPQYLPLDEKHPVSFANPYMGSKIITETLSQQLSETLKIPLIILRGFNIYGKQRVPGRLITHLLDAIEQNIPITLNDPHPKRDYLYIKDFHQLLFKIIGKTPSPAGIYNVGSGQSYSNLEVAKIAQIFANKTLPIEIQSNPRPHDIQDCTVNVDLIKTTFSWAPAYSLQQGLEDLIRIENSIHSIKEKH